MPLSNYLRNRNIMDLINGETGSSSQTYLALSSTAPNPDGTNVTEPAGTFETTGYKRISVKYNIIGGQSAPNFPTSATYDSEHDIYIITNTRDIYFNEARSTWPTITHFAIYNSETGGSMLAYGALNSSISPTSGMIPVIRTGQLTISEEQTQSI